MLADALPKPDLIIYLDYPAPKILERIKGRGRDIKKDVPESYIQDLQREIIQRLNDPSNTTPVLILNMEELDVIKNPDDVQKIVKMITQKLSTDSKSNLRFSQKTISR